MLNVEGFDPRFYDGTIAPKRPPFPTPQDALNEVHRLWGHYYPGYVPECSAVREVWPELADALDEWVNGFDEEAA
jgi:hypothetical protein